VLLHGLECERKKAMPKQDDQETSTKRWQIVAIDTEDGVTKRHVIIYDAPDYDEAIKKYLAGEGVCIALLDPEEEPFFDVSPEEYILCCEEIDF
jgi:hypothetical protein